MIQSNIACNALLGKLYFLLSRVIKNMFTTGEYLLVLSLMSAMELCCTGIDFYKEVRELHLKFEGFLTLAMTEATMVATLRVNPSILTRGNKIPLNQAAGL